MLGDANGAAEILDVLAADSDACMLVKARAMAALGVPTYAIGGVTAERAASARAAGAWGVAAITALWDAVDPYAATCAMLAPWQRELQGAA